MGFAGLFSRRFWFPTVLVGLMGALAQLLDYYLNTWLPVLMEQAGFNAKGSLAFLLVLSGGAIVGALAGSRFADRFGPKPVVAVCFLIGAVFIALLTVDLPLTVRLLFVAIVGLGTTGTSILIYGLVANHFPTKMRGAAVAWAAGLRPAGRCQRPAAGRSVPGRRSRGELGLLCPDGPGLLGVILTLLLPKAHRENDIHSTPIEPAVPVGTVTSAGPQRGNGMRSPHVETTKPLKGVE